MTLTSLDDAAIASLRSEPLPTWDKSLPPTGLPRTIESIVSAGWNALEGDLPLPLMVLREAELANNLGVMADFCREHDVWLAPHGKTTMAPQLFARQVAAGCWAMTAATPSHAVLYRAFRVQRIFYANQLVEPWFVRWLTTELERDPAFEWFCLADSVAGVDRLADALDRHPPPRPLQVLVEIGHPGGRTGCRTLQDALGVVAAVERCAHLELRGVEAFEGTLGAVGDPGAAVRAFLDRVKAMVEQLFAATSLADRSEAIVSAGGSAFFDHVIAALHPASISAQYRLVLRSGCYIAHDGGFYSRTSPLAAQRGADHRALKPAIEVWSVVLSRPEPRLAITSAGKRDVSIDLDLPRPVRIRRRSGEMRDVTAGSMTVDAISDQHLHIAVDADDPLEPGDLVGCTISHPCTTFDKWRLIPIVDAQYRVIDVVRTYF